MGKKNAKLIAEKMEKWKQRATSAGHAKNTAGIAAIMAAMGLATTLVVGGVSDNITDVCMNKIASDIVKTDGYQDYATDRRHSLSAQFDLREISEQEFASQYSQIGTTQSVLRYARESEDREMNVIADNYDKSKDFAHTFTHKAAPAMLIAGLGSAAVCGAFDLTKTMYELKLENAKKKEQESEMAD